MYRIASATGEENRTMSQLIFNPKREFPKLLTLVQL